MKPTKACVKCFKRDDVKKKVLVYRRGKVKTEDGFICYRCMEVKV